MDNQNPIPQSVQPEPVKPKQPMNIRLLAIAGLILFMILAVSGGFYLGLKQTNNQQATSLPTPTPTPISQAQPTHLPTTPPEQINAPSTTAFYSTDLDATLYIPTGWTINVINRDPSMPTGTQTPCYPSNKAFYKDPSQCVDAADTFLIGINTTSKQPSWPNADMSIVGPTSGLGGACPPEDFNYITETLTINNKGYSVKYAQDKSSGAYQDCFLFPAIEETGAKSKWSQFNVFFQAKDKTTLDQMLNILQTAKFN
jgi:hypothetical protein